MDKVTTLKTVSSARPPKPLPRPVEKASVRACELLVGYLCDMLDSADDKLFDLSDGQQSGALDAMRELRLKRAGVESGFRQALENQFRSAYLGEDRSSSSVLGKLDLDSLSLVQEDQMEVDLAINTMSRRVRMISETQLRAFNHRLEYLSEGKREFSERNSPLDPAQIVAAFRVETEKLDVDINTRLIMYKLFERLVLSELGFVITEANQTLIDSGILPDMTAPPIRASRQPGQSVPKVKAGEPQANPIESLLGSAGGGAAADPAALYAMFGELLDAVRLISARPDAGPAPSNMAVMQGGVAYVNGAPVTNPGHVRQVSSNDLVGMLNRLQRVETSLEELGQESHDPLRAEDMDVRVELSSLLGAEGGEEAVHALDQADDAVINLVSMLFDFIFDDQALATEIKALIGRLQIPFLKTAIADKSFFSNEQHAARQFLNTLAKAGSQWSSSQGVSDPLYRLIRESVFKVLNDFDLDAGLFERLRADIEDVMDRQESQRQRIEERLQEVEQGKVLAEQTRRIVTVAVQERIGQRALPAVAGSLIRDAWQQVLYLTCLREGSGSEPWNRYLKVLEVLIWSVLPKKDDAARAKLADLAPKLIVSLRKGLEAIGYDASEQRRRLDELVALHAQLLQPVTDSELAGEVVVFEPEPEPQAEQQAQEELPIDHPTLKMACAMKSGTWVDIASGEGSKRLRLAANVRHGSKLVFINARGIREAEYSGMALALAVEAGEIRIVDGSPLFDRALESVIGDLRRMRQQPVSA
ncbi:MAG: DUF1631 domain-containing protein [Alcanivoracaceae bacterium]|nr:DUF1631 domain-containing protein [Alcanivoracaceae bacterium]